MKEVLKISKAEDNNLIIDNMEATRLDLFNIMFIIGNKLSEATGIEYNDVLDSLMLIECDDMESLELENNNKNILEDINNG